MSHFTINRVVLIGRLTRDPELRALPSGTSVCGLRIACNSARKDADGEFVERPNFFDVNVYGAAAESVSRYIHKGSRVGVDGRLEWREWETTDQAKRQAVDIVAETVQFLDGPSDRVDLDAPNDGDDREPVGVGVGLDEDDLGF
jgi:single-strand DNA-binding protein